MNNKNILIIVIVSLVVAAGAFYGGMLYQQKQQPRFMFGSRQGGQMGQPMGGQMPRNMSQNSDRPVSGEIISQDDKSITIKMPDGSTKIVILSESTGINKAAEGTKSDLTSGTKVLVLGKTNPDGSVTAENIQLNPQMRGFGDNRNNSKNN